MSEREANDGFVCLPHWTIKIAVAIIVVSLVLFAIGVMGMCRAAWGQTLTGCCTTSAGFQYAPSTIFGSFNHGCATDDTWIAAPCSGVTPTPTPKPGGTPGPCPPLRLHQFAWRWLDTSIPTLVAYVCKASLEGCFVNVTLWQPPPTKPWLLHLRYGGCCNAATGTFGLYQLGHVLLVPQDSNVESIVVTQAGKAIPPDGW